MDEAILRPEQLAERAARELVAVPRFSRVATRLIAGAAVATLLVLALVPWQQTVSGSGRVVAFAPVERQQVVDAPLEGRVARWLVREGSHVRAGDLLAEITDNDPALLSRLRDERAAAVGRLEAARARVASLEGRVAALTGARGSAVAAAGARVRMAAERTRAAQQSLDAAVAALEAARLNLERQRALGAEGLSSRRTVELAELESVRARTEVDRARATLAAAQSEERALRSDRDRALNDTSASVQDAAAARAVAQAEVAAATAEILRLDTRLARQGTQAVTAPRDGTVLRVATNGQGGEMVKPGDPLLVLVPDTSARAAELWVDGNDVPLVAPGRPVRLQFEGWPAVQFSGWPAVATGTFGGRVALIDPADDGRGRFRVLVVPDAPDAWPSERFLRQGARANGWILLSRVRLGYELWRRFNGFPPVVAPAEPGKGSAYGGKK